MFKVIHSLPILCYYTATSSVILAKEVFYIVVKELDK